MFTQNDYKILEAIVDRYDKKKGTISTRGTTKKEIAEKTHLSPAKITNTLLTLKAAGYIEYGLKVKNANSYIVTDFGMKEMLLLKGKKLDKEGNVIKNE